MRYRKLTSTGDYSFGKSQKDFYIDQPEAPAQAVGTRLKLQTGEWFLNKDEGTPYQELILGVNRQTTADPAIKQRILDTQGVSTIADYSSQSDPNYRSLNVVAVIDTDYGTAVVTA